MKKKIAFLVMLFVLLGLLGCQKKEATGGDSKSQANDSVVKNDKVLTGIPLATETLIPTNTLAPTSTPVPTNTPTPTSTPIPSNTPMPSPTSSPLYVPEGEYAQTIMVYMVGSDLESDYAAGSIDLLEMLSSEVNVAYNNVVVYTGGAF